MEVIDLTKYNYKDKDSTEFIENVLKKINGYFPKKETIKQNYKTVEIDYYNDNDDKIKVIYKSFNEREFIDLLSVGDEIDVSFTYIQNFEGICGNNLTKELKFIKNLKAYFSFINGGMKFHYVNFIGNSLDFERATFMNGSVTFINSTFECENIKFIHSKIIKSNIWFKNSKLNNSKLNAQFINLINSDFHIKESSFIKGSVSFFLANSENSEILLRSESMEETKLNFEMSNLDKVVLAKLTFKAESNFKFDSINKLEFINCNIQTDICLDGIAKYKCLYFNEVINNGKIFIDWDNNNVFNAIENKDNYINENQILQIKFIYEHKLKQYRLLKNNFNNIGYHEDEDKALVCYMDNYLKFSLNHLKEKSIFKNVEYLKEVKSKKSFNFCSTINYLKIKLAIYIERISKRSLLISRCVGRYGTSPSSILITAFICMLGFATAYWCVGITLPRLDECGNIIKLSFGDAFYFSGITFLTIGYGDITPYNAYFKLLTVTEGFIGIFLMSYFSVAIVRKLVR